MNQEGFMQRKGLLQTLRGFRINDSHDHGSLARKKTDVGVTEREELHCPQKERETEEHEEC